MKDQKIQSPALARKIKREKLVSYDNARTCLFKNLRVIFLSGHHPFNPIIGDKVDDLPVRLGGNNESYIVDFKMGQFDFTDEEARMYDRASTIMLNETHALLTESIGLQTIIGMNPQKKEILLTSDEALFVLVKGLCARAPSILNMDDAEYFPDTAIRHDRKKPDPLFSLNQTVSMSAPLPKSHFNRREMNYRESGGFVLPYAMRDIDAFMRQSDPRTRAPLRFAIH
ncbi:MAG: hypothetical protein CMH32_07725 [Micavibrio sp.]|nr:hypothetical protein [Micavibrio sp.]HCK31951.1 hypothetical protein [Rhodospirillaceae bacterium]